MACDTTDRAKKVYLEGTHAPNTGIMGIYPLLRERIDYLCQSRCWHIVGASALVRDEEAYYFEITKPKFWDEDEEGHVLVGIGGIGGSIEEGENEITCLHREALEELGVDVRVLSSPETHLLFSEKWAGKVNLGPAEVPAPCLCTIGPKEARLAAGLPYDFLCIVTFEALLMGRPQAEDLYGLLRIRREVIEDILGPDTLPLSTARSHPGVDLQLNGELPDDAILRPLFTARSFQLLLKQRNHECSR